jgi:fatty-acyl-CoA synthase
MQRASIRSAQDLRAIEAAPYASFMAYRDVHQALAEVAGLHAERFALTALAHAEDTAPRRWTYAQLLADIQRASQLFTGLADGDEPRVALLLPPLPEAWIGLWAAESAGIACPINHALDEAHLAALLEATRANLLLTLAPGHAASDIGERVQQLRARCPGLRQIVAVGAGPDTSAAGMIDFEAALRRHASDALPRRNDAARIAALFHTGGTTGLPKLAQHTHGNQLHAAWGAAQLVAATEHDVILNGFPLFHVAGAFVYGLSMLLSGAEVVLPPPLGWRDPAFVARAWAVTRERRVSVLATVPTVMSALLAAPRAAGDAAGVRLLLTGGSPLPAELAARCEAETGIPVRNILGMTECAGIISIEPALAVRTPGSCGLPLPFTEVQAVSADGQALPAGDSGVLRVRGPNVGPGYTDAARNAGSFEDGWLITGDIGHVDAEGRVFVTGRAKDLIIRGAHNIDPGMIEEALLAHPQVQLAAAVGEPDEYAGELPVAFVVPRPGSTLDEGELLAFAAEHIAERAACPKRITVLSALPLTAIGKVYKPALRLQAMQRVVQDRLDRAGLGARVRSEGEDRGGRLVLRFVPTPGESATALQEPLRAVMAGFAIAYDIGDATTA